MDLANIQLDKQKKTLIVIICALIVYVESSFILKAQLTAVRGLSSKITGLKSELSNINRDLEKMNLAQSQQGKSSVSLALKSSKLMAEGQISGLLQDISNQANKFDIKISQIRPTREAGASKAALIPDKFVPLLIYLDIVADYHNLGRFINALENSSVFLGVQELKISMQLPDYLKQKVNMVLKTYVTR